MLQFKKILKIIYFFCLNKIPGVRYLIHSNNKLREEKALLISEIADFIYHLNPISLTKDKFEIGIKNILHINTFDSKGGAAKIAYQLFSYIKYPFISNLLVGTKFTLNEKIYELKDKNHFLSNNLRKYEFDNGVIDLYEYSSLKINSLNCYLNADLIHLHNLHGYYFNINLLPQICKSKKVIWTFHDMQPLTGHCAYSFACNEWQNNCHYCPDLSIYPELKFQNTEVLIKIKKRIYECSDFVIVCPSKWLKNIVESSILKGKEIHLIYNGIDSNVFNPIEKHEARINLKIPVEKKVLLFSANLSIDNKFKGGEFILKIIEYFKSNNEILFLNIGGNVQQKSKNVWDMSYINNDRELAQYYSAADLFIYPSLADNCPLVVLEAMACGTPVITFQTGGIPEIVEHLKSGYIARYKDLNDFIDGVLLFLNEKEIYNKAVKYGIEIVKNKFNITKMLEQYADLYKDILK